MLSISDFAISIWDFLMTVLIALVLLTFRTRAINHPGTSALTCTDSGYPDSTSDLSVTLPVGVFLRQQRIIGSRLNVPRAVDRARCNRMFARRGILPIQAPEFPGKVLVLTSHDRGANPRSVVHADLDPLDRTSPGCSLDLITAAS